MGKQKYFQKNFGTLEQNKEEAVYSTKTVALDDENMEESIASATEQFVGDLLNFEKQLIAEIDENQ